MSLQSLMKVVPFYLVTWLTDGYPKKYRAPCYPSGKPGSWSIDWMVFYAAFNSISVISRRQLTLFMLSWVSPVLGWALKCLAQGHSHEKKNPEDPVRLEPRIPGLRVKHFTTGPRGTQKPGSDRIIGNFSSVFYQSTKYFINQSHLFQIRNVSKQTYFTEQRRFTRIIRNSIINPLPDDTI